MGFLRNILLVVNFLAAHYAFIEGNRCVKHT